MAEKKRGVIAKALGLKKKKPKSTITGGYSPDKRSQGQKHAQQATKKKTQNRHQSLLTNDGKGTPRPKVKSISAVSKPKQGPKEGPASKINTSTKGLKRVATKGVESSVKAQGLKKADVKASSKIEKKEPTLKFKKSGKEKRAMKLSKKADAGAASGKITKKKYDKLNKKAVRKLERAKGTRKTAAGTALSAAGRGLANLASGISGGGATYSYKGVGKKKKAHVNRKVVGK